MKTKDKGKMTSGGKSHPQKVRECFRVGKYVGRDKGIFKNHLKFL